MFGKKKAESTREELIRRVFLGVENGMFNTVQPVRTGELALRAGGATERGGRYANEDWFLLDDNIVCVSDGVGGAPYGDVMARICCGAMRDAWQLVNVDEDVRREFKPVSRLLMAAMVADEMASKQAEYLGTPSAATLVAMGVAEGQLVFCGVGDSQAYLVADGELEPVLPGNGRSAEGGSVLDIAMGYYGTFKNPDKLRQATVEAREGQVVLLCTDGVWSQLESRRIIPTLVDRDDPAASAQRIALAATKAYGDASDNATAVLAVVERGGDLRGIVTPERAEGQGLW